MENRTSKYVVWASTHLPSKNPGTSSRFKEGKEIARESFTDKLQAEMFYDKFFYLIESEHLKEYEGAIKTEGAAEPDHTLAYIEMDVESNFQGRSQMLRYNYFHF